jgi:hypothetical protein
MAIKNLILLLVLSLSPFAIKSQTDLKCTLFRIFSTQKSLVQIINQSNNLISEVNIFQTFNSELALKFLKRLKNNTK